jgi:hypothetical protein
MPEVAAGATGKKKGLRTGKNRISRFWELSPGKDVSGCFALIFRITGRYSETIGGGPLRSCSLLVVRCSIVVATNA